MEYERSHHPSFSDKLRQSLYLYCCFLTNRRDVPSSPSSSSSSGDRSTLVGASSEWPKSRPQELPDFSDKCRNLIGRIGRHHWRRSSPSSADFRYDPLGYALNFDDSDDIHEYPLRNLSARVPASPSPEAEEILNPAVSRAIIYAS